MPSWVSLVFKGVWSSRFLLPDVHMNARISDVEAELCIVVWGLLSLTSFVGGVNVKTDLCMCIKRNRYSIHIKISAPENTH